MLSTLSKHDVEIYALSVKKGRQQIKDTPENWAVVLCALLEQCLSGERLAEIAIDFHFSQSEKHAALGQLIKATLGLPNTPKSVDSKANACVQLADFVAGSVQYARCGETRMFYDLIRPRVAKEQVCSWKELKRAWLEKTRGKERMANTEGATLGTSARSAPGGPPRR